MLLVLTLILAALGYLYSPDLMQTTGSTEPFEAPALEYELPAGGKGRLADLRGKVVLVNFWAHWCGYCLREMPKLSQLELEFADKNFALLAVHVGPEKSQAMGVRQLPTRVGFDMTGEAFGRFGGSGLPHFVLIDKTGKVVLQMSGGQDWRSSRLTDQIRALLDV